MTAREYVGFGITVHWDSERCFHSERCASGAPTVFDKAARPWVNLTDASPDAVADVIDTCPSGALSYTRTDGIPNGRRGRAADEDPAASIAADSDRVTPGPEMSANAATVTINRLGFSAPGVKSPRETPPSGSFGRIASIASLREHLQCAIELEHSTLPPYLCALYSLDPARNKPATEVLASVLMEEMLHLTLAANLLNAVGGQPRLDTPEMMPGYPRCLPHGDQSFQMSLLPFGTDALQQFLRIEQPAPPGATAQGDQYETIGQFYDAIRQGLRDLCAEFGEKTIFCGHPARQVTSAFSYGGSGHIIAIDNLATALAALHEIVEQGEGASADDIWDGDRDMFHPARDEVAHFYRIQELVLGRRYRRGDTPQSGPTGQHIAIDPDGIQPMQRDPRGADHADGDPIRVAQHEFNVRYCELLSMLDRAFDGAPQVLGEAVGVMYQLKPRARALMQMQNKDGLTTSGPSFEYVLPEHRRLQASTGSGRVNDWGSAEHAEVRDGS